MEVLHFINCLQTRHHYSLHYIITNCVYIFFKVLWNCEVSWNFSRALKFVRVFFFLWSNPLLFIFLHRSQEVFRQAMRLPTVRLEVLPMTNKERFEKSLIGHLFSTDSHDGTPRPKEPPPLKVKPMVRPAESSSCRQAGPQESSSMSMGGRSLGSPLPFSLYPRGKSSSPVLKKSHTISPLVGFATKKGGKRLKIDLKKGTYVWCNMTLWHVWNMSVCVFFCVCVTFTPGVTCSVSFVFRRAKTRSKKLLYSRRREKLVNKLMLTHRCCSSYNLLPTHQ